MVTSPNVLWVMHYAVLFKMNALSVKGEYLSVLNHVIAINGVYLIAEILIVHCDNSLLILNLNESPGYMYIVQMNQLSTFTSTFFDYVNNKNVFQCY